MDKLPDNEFKKKFVPFAKKATDGKKMAERSNCLDCGKPMNGKGVCDGCKAKGSYQ